MKYISSLFALFVAIALAGCSNILEEPYDSSYQYYKFNRFWGVFIKKP